jgi:hypothetical protein
MGYGAQAWAVDLGLIRGEIGSGDPELARRHGLRFTEHLRDVQSFIDDVTGADGAVTMADVARHMILGEPYDDRLGFAYGYFLQYLCEVQGTWMHNPSMMPIAVDLPERLDRVLAERGLLADGFSVSDLLFGGAPVPLPPIGDFPGIGFREFGALEEPAGRLARLGTMDDVAEEFAGPAYDVFQWLSQAHDMKRSVVSFFH